jgi:hypothetical protein
VQRQIPANPGTDRGAPGSRSLPTTYPRRTSPVAPPSPPRVPVRPGGPVQRAFPRPAAQPPGWGSSEGRTLTLTRGPAPVPADLGRPFSPGHLNASPSSEVLSVSKVVAGGMAASTSAVLGSYLGAFGTVGGAAFGAVATAVVSHFYQQSIDTMDNRVKSKVRTVRGRPALEPAAPVQHGTTTRPAGNRGVRALTVLAAGTLMIFLLALALVTGIEWAKGSSLSGGLGSTSLQGVLHPSGASQTPRVDPTQPQVAPGKEGSQPGGSSCLSDSSGSSDSGRSSDSSCLSESSCPSDSSGPSDSGRPSDSNRSSDSSCPSDTSRSSDSNRSSDSSHPEGSPESTASNSPSGSSDPRCRGGSYPSLLCGPLRLGAR